MVWHIKISSVVDFIWNISLLLWLVCLTAQPTWLCWLLCQYSQSGYKPLQNLTPQPSIGFSMKKRQELQAFSLSVSQEFSASTTAETLHYSQLCCSFTAKTSKQWNMSRIPFKAFPFQFKSFYGRPCFSKPEYLLVAGKFIYFKVLLSLLQMLLVWWCQLLILFHSMPVSSSTLNRVSGICCLSMASCTTKWSFMTRNE